MTTFIEANAPMTAKCVIRDAIKPVMSDKDADRLTVKIVSELRAQGYEITARKL